MIEFDYEIEIEGHKIHATVEADGRVYRENYGADADGRRGEMRTFLDDLEVTVKDGRGKDITEKLAKKHKAIYADIEEMAEDKLYDEFNEPEEGDYDIED
jgi:hypothetical protein